MPIPFRARAGDPSAAAIGEGARRDGGVPGPVGGTGLRDGARHRSPLAALGLAAALTMAGCAPGGGAPARRPPDPPASSDPRFDWFTYEGRDPIYDSLRAGPDEYLNPIIPGFHPDPSICRSGDDYYLVNSSFAWFPGVPIFHSRNLVDWTPIGHVLDRPEQLDLDGHGISRGIFAPTIRCHGDTFYVITTLVDTGGTLLVTATDPAGPWSDPVWLPEVDGIDPSMFFDADGRVWITNNGPPDRSPLYEGHRAIWIQEYDPGSRRMVGPRTVLVDGGVDITKQPIWIEGPHLFRVDSLYYLIAAEGGTAENHSEVVFRSRSVRGPYEPYPDNPILTQRHLDPDRPYPITSTGHADFVRLPDGSWWAVFLGTRPYRDDLFNTGRETFLMPVDWVDGWPVITEGEESVPWVHRRPDLPREPGAPPRAGNFAMREEFDTPDLPRQWSVIRTPRERWHALDAPDGWLTLRARPVALGSSGQPTFVARRQQHGHAVATTSMRYRPERPGDRAGLAAFYDDRHFYLLTVTRGGDGSPEVRLERRAAGSAAAPPGEARAAGAGAVAGSEVVARAPIPESAGDRFRLRIEARGSLYDFSYAVGDGDWIPLAADVDGTILSTGVAGGFVGAFFGLYAYGTAPR